MSVLFKNAHVAEGYARHRGWVDEAFVDRIADLLFPARTVLDVGAGVGAPAYALEQRGFRVVGLEPSEAMIQAGRSRYPGVTLVRGIGELLPLRDESVDAAMLLYVLHHVLDPVAVLSETRRVVRGDGDILVVSGKSDCDRSRFFGSYFPTLFPDLPQPEEIGGWASTCGLDVADVLTAVHWVYRSQTVDEEYLEMVENEMFAALRALNEREFEDGLVKLRADLGKRLPPPEVTLSVLRAA